MQPPQARAQSLVCTGLRGMSRLSRSSSAGAVLRLLSAGGQKREVKALLNRLFSAPPVAVCSVVCLRAVPICPSV